MVMVMGFLRTSRRLAWVTGKMTVPTRAIGHSGGNGQLWESYGIPCYQFPSNVNDKNHQVSLYTFVPPLASSMMAPGLDVIARQYVITNETYIALTLSVFLLSFAIGVSIISSLT